MPLSRGAATFEVEANGEEQLRVTMTMDYDMKYRPLGWLMNAVMLRPTMSKLPVAVPARRHRGRGFASSQRAQMLDLDAILLVQPLSD